ncbi:MAG: DMT family transporter [Cohaesibacter sp.]|nr:DMT family transporter [Cohaesibacter sp.]
MGQPRYTFASNLKGIAFGLAGTALFAPIFAAGKFADGAVPILVVIFMRYFSAFLLVLGLLLFTKTSLMSLKSSKPSQHLLRAFFSVGSAGFTIYAASIMPLTEATAIGLTEGVIAVALAAIFLGERVTSGHWLAGLLCMAGAYFILFARADGGFAFSLSALSQMSGAGYAFLGAIFMALELLVLKVLARRESALALLVHVTGLCSLLLIGPALYLVITQEVSLWAIAPFFALGPIATLAQYCNIRAYRLAEISLLAPVNYSWIVFSTLLGLIVFDEVPSAMALFGGSMIVAGGIWLAKLPTLPAHEGAGLLNRLKFSKLKLARENRQKITAK